MNKKEIKLLIKQGGENETNRNNKSNGERFYR